MLFLRILSTDAYIPLSIREAWARVRNNWDWAGAEQDILQALQLEPKSVDWRSARDPAIAQDEYASFLCLMGRHEEALACSRRALELLGTIGDDLIHQHAAMYMFYARAGPRHDRGGVQRAGRPGAKGLSMSFIIGLTYTAKGMYDEAIAVFQKMPRMSDTTDMWALGYAYGRAGYKSEASRILTWLQEHSYPNALPRITYLYIGLDDKDKAFELLDAEQDPRFTYSPTSRKRERFNFPWLFMRVDPLMDPLRSDPRFQYQLQCMNFPP